MTLEENQLLGLWCNLKVRQVFLEPMRTGGLLHQRAFLRRVSTPDAEAGPSRLTETCS